MPFLRSGTVIGVQDNMAALRKKQIHVATVAALIALAVVIVYPAGSKLLIAVRMHSYAYGYTPQGEVAAEDVSALPSAQAVPILMYHGVIVGGAVRTNTSRENFIGQMEMLKQKGYETISVAEYDLFREGEFTLPAKPVIITFDDGRKDSFYPVDAVLKKLGFRATIFVATIMANESDSFYLGWDELVKLQATGRWEIEAHGRRSHEEIPTDEEGTRGRYYTARQYVKGKGLESVGEYQKRVEEDYINGIADIRERLAVDASYFAVPLSDYGDHEAFEISESEYTSEFNFNRELTRKYFRLAFLQAGPYEGFYNYRDSNPHELRRLDVQNMTADELLQRFERFSPKPFPLEFSGAEPKSAVSFLKSAELLYGELTAAKGVTLASSASIPSARMLFGDRGWKNYSVTMRMVREKGRSASLIAYFIDERNFVSLDWGEQSLRLAERVDGNERELASYYPWEKDGEVEILVRVRDGFVSAYFSGIILADGLPTKLSRGAAGFGVWDPQGAQSTIRKLEITSPD